MPQESDEGDLDSLIQTGLNDAIAIGLVENLFQEAGIPFFAMDQNVAARQESGNLVGWWSIRVSRKKEAEARAILDAVTKMK